MSVVRFSSYKHVWHVRARALLEIEVDPTAEQRMPILKDIRGHRNVEVYYFIKVTGTEFWDRWLREH